MGTLEGATLARTLKSNPAVLDFGRYWRYERIVWSGGYPLPEWADGDESARYDGASSDYEGTVIRIDDEDLSQGAYVTFDLLREPEDDWWGVSLRPNGDYYYELFTYVGPGSYELEMRPTHARWRKDGGAWTEIDITELLDLSAVDWVYEMAVDWLGNLRIMTECKYWMLGIALDGVVSGEVANEGSIANINIYFLGGSTPTPKPFWTEGVSCRYVRSDGVLR